MASYKDQDHPYGTVTVVAGAATFSDSQSGIMANGNVIEIGKSTRAHCVVSALSTDGLSCTLTPLLSLAAVGFYYSGRQTSIRG